MSGDAGRGAQGPPKGVAGDLGEVNRRAKAGVKMLLGRQAAIQVLTFAGGIVLARTLTPTEFGVFGIATFLVNVLALIGDFGLAPSFIQRKEDLSERDLQVGFTLQQVLITGVVLALWVLAPWLVGLYEDTPPEMVWLVRALALGLYLTTWRSMSALQLERRLEYKGLAFVEVVESLSYQAVAVGMAVAGFGIWSLVVAVLVRGLLGAVLIYAAAPWRVRFAWDGKVAREVLRYGIPFQAQRIVHSVQGWIGPILVASLIGPQALGFLTWAGSNGRKPLVLVDSFSRVAFPQFARLQDDRAELERVLARYIGLLLLPTGLWFAVLAVAGADLVDLVYTEKWVPAVPALVLYALAANVNVVNWLAAVAANGTGRAGSVARVVVVRSLVTWGGSVLLVPRIGFIALPIMEIAGALIIETTFFLRLIGPGVLSRLARSLRWLALPAVTAVGVGMGVRESMPDEPWALPVYGGAVLILYVGTALAVGPPWVRTRVHSVVASVRQTVGGRLAYSGAE